MNALELLRSLFGTRPPAAPSPAGRSREPQPARQRHVHLGMDFGTCWSKLVLRDYEAPTDRCFVVRPGARFDAGSDYRIPSSVTVHDGRLYFGWTGRRMAERPGAKVVTSPKMRAAFPTLFADQERSVVLNAEELSILVVVYLLQVGFAGAQSYCAGLSQAATPRMTMSMGAPMSVLDDGPLRDLFVSIARVAYEIWRASGQQANFAKGVGIDLARDLLTAARARVAQRAVIASREWVRSEAEAGLLWIFRSPRVSEGLYGCIDVGAGTTDVSFFRIRMRKEGEAWVKDALGFYSARSAPPAMDTLGECLAKFDGRAAAMLRGEENDVIRRHSLAQEPTVRSMCGRIHETYRQTWAEAYKKEKGVARWQNFGLFVLGGGSAVELVADALEGSVWQGQLLPRRIADAGIPEDLFDWPTGPTLRPFREGATFLLVAYGLSFLGTDVPEVDNPSEMPPLVIPRNPLGPRDQDEYYPK